MKIFAISDLHLSFGTNKPMDIFGDKWTNYENKIRENWIKKVSIDDIVILAGDFSWGTYIEDSLKDFEFLESLPGKKILLKGNHDYWWETISKMERFLEENNFNTISFLHNNFFETPEYMICGTRYWSYTDGEDNEKIFNREMERAKISLKVAREKDSTKPVIFVTHYPPDGRIIGEVAESNVKIWVYGHIHSNYEELKVEIPGIKAYLTSCDYLKFDLIQLT